MLDILPQWQGVEMKAEMTRIAQASITDNTDSFNWGDVINQKLGVLSKYFIKATLFILNLSIRGNRKSLNTQDRSKIFLKFCKSLICATQQRRGREILSAWDFPLGKAMTLIIV